MHGEYAERRCHQQPETKIKFTKNVPFIGTIGVAYIIVLLQFFDGKLNISLQILLFSRVRRWCAMMNQLCESVLDLCQKMQRFCGLDHFTPDVSFQEVVHSEQTEAYRNHA